MKTVEVLEKIGLSQKEAQIYLLLLANGKASANSLAQKANIKRPTTYAILDSLEKRGLVSRVPQDKKTLYTVESPELLKMGLQRKQDLLSRIMPELLAQHKGVRNQPQAQLFTGPTGVRSVYDLLLQSSEVWFFANIKEFLEFQSESLGLFQQKLLAGQIRGRELLSMSPTDVAYAKKVKSQKSYEIRFLPKQFKLSCDGAIFADKLALFFYRPQMFALLITSQDFSNSMRTLYELAWMQARSLEQVAGA